MPTLTSWGVDARRITVIENWAPLDDLRPMDKVNAWSRVHGLADKRVIMYCGTLGLKHDPASFIALADAFSDDNDARVVVISEGLGADWLAKRSGAHSISSCSHSSPSNRCPRFLPAATSSSSF